MPGVPVVTAGTATPPAIAAEAFVPPLSDLPPDIQAAVRRSNEAKKPDQLMLYPFLGGHEGPLPAKELSARFAREKGDTDRLLALHARMKPFDIWKNVKLIVSVYSGVGSKGIFCEPFDHDAFLAQMKGLARGPVYAELDPNVVPLSAPLMDSKFCQDQFNVHGARDSFREMVKQGPGLHICITQPAARGNTPCDLHIDEVQQGQVCTQGYCVPLLNGQTIEHLRTVGPWLAVQPVNWVRERLGLPPLKP